MYLVSPDYLSTVTSKNNITSPVASKVRKAPKAEKHNSSSKRRRRSAKQKIKSQREHDRWAAQRLATRRDYVKVRDYDKFVKVRAKLHEADVERKRQIMTVADFLKQVLPSAASSSPTQLKASHSWTQTEQNITS